MEGIHGNSFDGSLLMVIFVDRVKTLSMGDSHFRIVVAASIELVIWHAPFIFHWHCERVGHELELESCLNMSGL